MIIDYLEKDEKYKIEASTNPNMFCIYLMTRGALISVNNGDTWKHVKKYIDKPRPNINTCSICYEAQCKHIITCCKCFVDICVLCITTILEKSMGEIPCPFCRNVVGQKLPPMAVHAISQGMRIQAMKPPDDMLDGIHLSNQ